MVQLLVFIFLLSYTVRMFTADCFLFVSAFGQSSSSPFGSQSGFGQTSNNPFAPKPFGSTNPFGSQSGASFFGSTSTGVFGTPQSSSPLGSTSVFGASSSPAFGASTTTFGSSSPAFGSKYLSLQASLHNCVIYIFFQNAINASSLQASLHNCILDVFFQNAFNALLYFIVLLTPNVLIPFIMILGLHLSGP